MNSRHGRSTKRQREDTETKKRMLINNIVQKVANKPELVLGDIKMNNIFFAKLYRPK